MFRSGNTGTQRLSAVTAEKRVFTELELLMASHYTPVTTMLAIGLVAAATEES